MAAQSTATKTTRHLNSVLRVPDSASPPVNVTRGTRRGRPCRNSPGGGGDSSSSDDSSNHSDDGGRGGRGDPGRKGGDRDGPDRPDGSPVSVQGTSAKNYSKWVRPDHYDGTTSFETFIVKFEKCGDFNGWNEEEKLAHLWASLQKEAAQLLWNAQDLSYEELVDKLKDRFGSRNLEKFQTELRCRRRWKGESVRELAQDIRRLLTLSYPGDQYRVVEHIGRDAFLTGLDHPDLEIRIREKEPQTLDAAVRWAQHAQATQNVPAVLCEGRSPDLVHGPDR